jgi:hypothetical protein
MKRELDGCSIRQWSGGLNKKNLETTSKTAV